VECDVLFRESRVTFFMGAIMGWGIQVVLTPQPQGKAEQNEKMDRQSKRVMDCTG
jgi:hypothetical protein